MFVDGILSYSRAGTLVNYPTMITLFFRSQGYQNLVKLRPHEKGCAKHDCVITVNFMILI